MRAVLGWMCAVDFDYELGEAADGTTIFASVEDLHKYRRCTAIGVEDHRGVEVVTMSKKDFTDLVKRSGIDPTTISDSNIGPVIWSKERGFLKSEGK